MAIDIIRHHQFNLQLATIDLERAYRNFSNDPLDWPLTCIKHRGGYYVDTGLPFGSRVSSLYMQKVAQFIQRSLARKGVNILIYLDDGLIFIERHQDPCKIMNIVLATIRSLGLPIAFDKIQMPSHECKFLGIIINVRERNIRIPSQKIKNFLAQIAEVKRSKTITKHQLQSIISSINYMSCAIQGARLFMNRLLGILRDAHDNNIQVNDDMLRDMDWFHQFAERFNGTTLINTGPAMVTIRADSCMVGGGATDGDKAYMYKYPPTMTTSFHINQLEALNCLIAM